MFSNLVNVADMVDLRSCLLSILMIYGTLSWTNYVQKGYVTALATSKEITDQNHILGDLPNGIYFEGLAKRSQRKGRPWRPSSPKPNRPGHMFLPPQAPLPPSYPIIKTPPPCHH
ncbi:hypothetical protein AQUCO_01700729v1 [Aquilegia coerulea]|uniref:Uncharacterized protein n=1 Tax=Aquilegia coerulea TaxID=218851 RepID=A0A2G5DPF7_AQUCA|nr:hypothetical protein AQUCO_01700729v1 [Aquilegia coerulea]